MLGEDKTNPTPQPKPVLESQTVFIDTSIFRNVNFCLNNEVFSEFKKLCRNGEFECVTTDITKGEIKRRIEEQSVEAFAGLDKFRDKTHLLPRMHSSFGKKYKQLTVLHIQKGLETAVSKFFKDVRAEVLPLPNNAVERVFKKYFEGKKPFQGEKKKSEFPDAFVIEALTSLKKKLYVISADGDFEGAHPDLIQLKTVSELLHIYNTHSNVIAEFIERLVKKHEWKIIKWLEAELSRIPVKVEGTNAEVRVYSASSSVRISHSWVVAVKKNTAELSLDVVYEIIGDVKIDEPGIFWEQGVNQQVGLSAQAEIGFKIHDESFFRLNNGRLDIETELTIPLEAE